MSANDEDDDAPTGHYQMSPEDYDLKALAQYDRPYLYSVIEWLDAANRTLSQEAFKLEEENRQLKSKLKKKEICQTNFQSYHSTIQTIANQVIASPDPFFQSYHSTLI